MLRKLLYGTFALFCTTLAGNAAALLPEPHGTDWDEANSFIFLQDEVTRLDITIDPADLTDIFDAPNEDRTKSVTIRWQNSVIDETLEDVGFRIRGNTSRNAERKSWKLEFREFVPDRDFYGLEEMNLNGSNNDPAIIRSMVSWEIMRRMGLPTSRTHLVAMYINGDFFSLQTHIEHIDEEFAETRFGNKDGNLYKCLYQGDRADLSPIDGDDYTNHAGGNVYREINNNNDPLRDYTDLTTFIRFLDEASNDQLQQDLEFQIDIDGVLRYLASNVALGAWDDYWYGSNNFYLYHNERSDRFVLIPYDYDNSLGIDFFGTNWSTRDFENWGDGGFGSTPAPLVEAVFSHSEWRRQYRRFLIQLVDILRDPELRQSITSWDALAQPYFNGTIENGGAIGSDPWFPNAVNVPDEWNGSGSQDGHRIGLIPFLDARADSLETQIANFFPTPPLPTIRINEAQSSNSETIADELGEFDDWVELYNAGTEAVDISGWFLTDALSRPTKFEFPQGTSIGPDEYLLVWADDTPEQGPLHMPYKLEALGEHLGLYHNVENGRVLIDEMALPQIPSDESHGRYPDGDGEDITMLIPTPGGPNNPTLSSGGENRTPPRLYINEFMASNENTISDEAGQFEDWIELYNDEDVALDLSGMFLTDDLTNPSEWRFPDGTTIAAKGFLLIWADNDEQDGPLHASFGLSKNGEDLGIFDRESEGFQLIDSLSFEAQVDDIATGRLPDGGATIQVMESPTPGSTNVPQVALFFEGFLVY